MLGLVTVSLLTREVYVRNKVFDKSFDDLEVLWANKRAMIYEPAERSTVFIGSSRIKFDLDINTWETLTSDHVIQLACVGSTPIPVLKNLGYYNNFKGKLVIDVTKILFFSKSPQNSETSELH